jgi:hypothetical protein
MPEDSVAVLDEMMTRRIEAVCSRLDQEFPEAGAETIRERASAVISELLAEARVTDFVPVLAYRATREILSSSRDAGGNRRDELLVERQELVFRSS